MRSLPAIEKKYNSKVEGYPFAEETLVFGHSFGTDQTSCPFVKADFKATYRHVLYDNVGGIRSDPAAIGYFHAHIERSKLLDINVEGYFPQLSAPALLSCAIQTFLR